MEFVTVISGLMKTFGEFTAGCDVYLFLAISAFLLCVMFLDGIIKFTFRR